MRVAAVKWQTRVDGEYRLCACCLKKGYGEDAYQPATREFWPRVNGRLWFGRCLACASEQGSRRKGIVPADAVALTAVQLPAALVVRGVSMPLLHGMHLVAA